MVLRKSDRARIVRDVMQPKRLSVPDQDAEDAAPVRQITDRSMSVRVDPGRQEPLECLAGLVDHPERCVAGTGELRCRLDNALQQGIERELRTEGDARVHEDAETTELVRFGAHRPILAQRADEGTGKTPTQSATSRMAYGLAGSKLEA
jgi:hypothetical protein